MLFKSRADKLFDQGVVFLNQANYPEAIKLFSQVIDVSSGSETKFGAYINRGMAYSIVADRTLYDNFPIGDEDREKIDEYCNLAIKDFSNAIYTMTLYYPPITTENKTDLADIYRKRAMTYLTLANFKEAIDDINKAIEFEPKNPLFHFVCGYLYAEFIGDASTGLDKYSKSITLSPSAETYLFRAWANFDLGKLDRAKEDFRSAIKLNPEYKSAKRVIPVTIETDYVLMFDKTLKWANFIESL